MEKSVVKLRHQLTPQMKIYDRLNPVWRPYLSFFHPPNFKSETCNTDGIGIRHTIDKNGDIISLKDCTHALIGGSTVFGVGSSEDSKTLTSQLSRFTSKSWANFGGRAFNSFQEFQLFCLLKSQLTNLKQVVILSGVNDLYLYEMANSFDPVFGHIFNQNEFVRQYDESRFSWKRRLYNKVTMKPKQGSSSLIVGDKSQRNFEQWSYRQMSLWSEIAKPGNLKICFALQPFATWVKRQLHKNEITLFSALSERGGSTHQTLEKLGYEKYLWYRAVLESNCKRAGIDFLDLNPELNKYEGSWLFVDRVHLTDTGYEYVAKFLGEQLC